MRTALSFLFILVLYLSVRSLNRILERRGISLLIRMLLFVLYGIVTGTVIFLLFQWAG